MSPDLVIAGNLLLDDVVHADGRTRMAEAGGAAYYAALAASLWGVRVGCLSVAGHDYPRAALATLAERGVDLAGVRHIGRPSLRTWLLYEAGGVRRVVHRLTGTSHADVSPRGEDLPDRWRGARAFHLAPMPLGCQEGLLRDLAAPGDRLLSLDPYELLTDANRERWRGVIAQADVFLPSEDDLRLADAESDPETTIASLSSGRLRWFAFKRGERGGICRDVAAGRAHAWSGRSSRVVDATGAGDAFAAGLLAALLAGLGIESALQRGVVSASFAIEDWGAAGLLAATPAAAERRMAEWFPRQVVA